MGLKKVGNTFQFSFAKPGVLVPQLTTNICAAASTAEADSRKPHANCGERPRFKCSNCGLVQYCSPEHQKAHWKVHKTACKSPLGSSSWEPAWVRRGDGFKAPLPQKDKATKFLHQHVQGELPAFNILGPASFESGGEFDRDSRISLCFATSTDVRSLIETVCSLPDDFRGTINVLMNDKDPYATIVNMTILNMLLNLLEPVGPDERALRAESAVFLLYSLRFSEEHSEFFERETARTCMPILRTHPELSVTVENKTGRPIHFHGELRGPTLENALLGLDESLYSPIDEDYWERHYVGLRPNHRVAIERRRRFGMVLPFGVDDVKYIEVNASHYNPYDYWFFHNAIEPLRGWNLREAIKTGERHNVTADDLYGCIYFHARERFLNFSQRMMKMKINITITNLDAYELAKKLAANEFPTFPPGCFDRIEALYLGDPTPKAGFTKFDKLFQAWGPLLKKSNKKATLLTQLKYVWIDLCDPDVKPVKLDGNGWKTPAGKELIVKLCKLFKYDEATTSDILAKGDKSPKFIHLKQHAVVFYDSDTAFREYYTSEKIAGRAKRVGLKRDDVNRIVPRRAGLALNTPEGKVPGEVLDPEDFYLLGCVQGNLWRERYVEFRPV